MSNDNQQREVPIILQAGKDYTSRNGNIHPIVETSPGGTWPARSSDWSWSLDGRRSKGRKSALDLIRPAYKLHGVYLNGFGTSVTIIRDDGSDDFPLKGSDGPWYSREGAYCGSHVDSRHNLLDYAPAASEAAPEPVAATYGLDLDLIGEVLFHYALSIAINGTPGPWTTEEIIDQAELLRDAQARSQT